jgi:hypothetical protein
MESKQFYRVLKRRRHQLWDLDDTLAVVLCGYPWVYLQDNSGAAAQISQDKISPNHLNNRKLRLKFLLSPNILQRLLKNSAQHEVPSGQTRNSLTSADCWQL